MGGGEGPKNTGPVKQFLTKSKETGVDLVSDRFCYGPVFTGPVGDSMDQNRKA